MNKRAILVFAGIMVLGSSFAQHKKSVSRPKKPADVHFGTASFYANKFEGRKTATGEIFSQKKMTAASNVVSLNTWVKVTNLRNKRSVIVKITDRMHPRNKRLIDLSRIAAKKLGYTGHGITRVKVEVLGKKQPVDWVVEPGN